MTQLVLIDRGTQKGNNEIGDIVAMHEDDVELGDSYKHFKIIKQADTKKIVIKTFEKFHDLILSAEIELLFLSAYESQGVRYQVSGVGCQVSGKKNNKTETSIRPGH